MGLVVFLAVVGALTIYAFHTLFDAPAWGFIVALVLFILGMNASHRSGPEEQERVGRFPAQDKTGMQRFPAMGNPAAALSFGIALIVGLGLGWLLWGLHAEELSASLFVRVQDQRLLATAPLKTALETVPSGSALVPLESRRNAQFRAKITFRNESRNYCRQYELTLGSRERMVGIACRIPSGDWSVALQSLLPPSVSGVTVPAGAGQNAAFDAAIGALIEGAPLVGEAEAVIMRNGWRK